MSDTINTNLVRHGCNVCPGGGHGWALQIISAYYVYQMSAAQKHQCWILAGRFMCAATQHLQNTSLYPILTHCNNNKWMHIYFRMSFTHFSPTHTQTQKKLRSEKQDLSPHLSPSLCLPDRKSQVWADARVGMHVCLCVCAKVSVVSPWYRLSWQPPSTRPWHRILAAPQTAGASAVQQLAWPSWKNRHVSTLQITPHRFECRLLKC